MRSELVSHSPGLAVGGAGHQGAREGGGRAAGRLQGDQGARPGREGWAVKLLPAGRAQGGSLLLVDWGAEELGMGVFLGAGDCLWPFKEGGREPGILVIALEEDTS